jgi:hypothetical protein
MARRQIIEVTRNRSHDDIAVIDSYDSAKSTREIFQGKPVKNERRQPFGWPRFVRYLGRTNAENYFSDKMLSGGKWEFYKHIAEGPQYLFINDAITSLVNDRSDVVQIRESSRKSRAAVEVVDGLPATFFAKSYEITGSMPEHLADLAPCKGIQWVDPSGKYFEARIPNSTLAAAKFPRQKPWPQAPILRRPEVVLVVYSNEGMHFLITGPKLNVTEDGIVG